MGYFEPILDLLGLGSVAARGLQCRRPPGGAPLWLDVDLFLGVGCRDALLVCVPQARWACGDQDETYCQALPPLVVRLRSLCCDLRHRLPLDVHRRWRPRASRQDVAIDEGVAVLADDPLGARHEVLGGARPVDGCHALQANRRGLVHCAPSCRSRFHRSLHRVRMVWSWHPRRRRLDQAIPRPTCHLPVPYVVPLDDRTVHTGSE
mmetsp:Transcript_29020/g.83244  ORF Transcript_29020/g.83244 Transcript_29020/m.83244 type:complete len:206 (-) Transcript_29020:964-1581(-)